MIMEARPYPVGSSQYLTQSIPTYLFSTHKMLYTGSTSEAVTFCIVPRPIASDKKRTPGHFRKPNFVIITPITLFHCRSDKSYSAYAFCLLHM